MIKNFNHIFIVGIKGVAMANLAIILKKMGKFVSGSDTDEIFITDELLTKNKIDVITNFDPTNLPKSTELVIYSAANSGEKNPQIIEAKRRLIRVAHQSKIVGEIFAEFQIKIAVCGTHGKTTTSSLLSYSLINLGQKPSYLIGSSQFNNYSGSDLQGRKFFVVEADEYGLNPPSDKTPKLHLLNPDLILATNVDFDHPDVYANIEEVKKSFRTFFSKCARDKSIFVCADDPSLMQVIESFPKKIYETFGFSTNADLVISQDIYDARSSNFNLTYKNTDLGQFRISLFGQKNVSNAAGAVLTLINLGFKIEKIKKAILGFTGAKRRFEQIYELNSSYLFDDYAHHPNEIRATINAAKNRFLGKRIIVIFQPHTYSRTQALLPEFTESLNLASKSFVLPIFPSAREDSTKFKITSRSIQEHALKLKMRTIDTASTKQELMSKLKEFIRPGDLVMTMGAGDVYKLKDDIIEIIKKL